MATIRSLLWARSRRAATPLPPSATLPLRVLSGRLGRRRVAAPDRDLATIGKADKAGRHDAFGWLETLSDNRLRLVLFLHRDRPHRDGVVIFDDVHKGAVRASLHRA